MRDGQNSRLFTSSDWSIHPAQSFWHRGLLILSNEVIDVIDIGGIFVKKTNRRLYRVKAVVLAMILLETEDKCGKVLTIKRILEKNVKRVEGNK